MPYFGTYFPDWGMPLQPELAQTDLSRTLTSHMTLTSCAFSGNQYTAVGHQVPTFLKNRAVNTAKIRPYVRPYSLLSP